MTGAPEKMLKFHPILRRVFGRFSFITFCTALHDEHSRVFAVCVEASTCWGKLEVVVLHSRKPAQDYVIFL